MSKKKFLKVSMIMWMLLLAMPLVAFAAGGVWVHPSSTPTTIGPNEGFSVGIHADTGTDKLGSYQFKISFDASKLQIDTTSGTNGVSAGADGFLTASNTDNANGSIRVNGFDLSGGKGPGSDLDVLTIYFNSLGITGQTALGLTVEDLITPTGSVIGTPTGTGGDVVICGTVDDTCNGLDDDCDGLIDDDFVPAGTTCGEGACAGNIGEATCVDGAIVDTCNPLAGAAPDDTTCDDIDDDCDGTADEDFSGEATICGVGECAGNTGLTTCDAGGVTGDTCDPTEGAVSDDNCDTLDNDCDGTADEDWSNPATTCGVGACLGNVGIRECAAGVMTDTCDPLAGAAPDDPFCDGIDDDCDGATDEDFAGVPTTCGVGECAGNTGLTTCVDGTEGDSCNALEGAVTEGPEGDASCSDGLDNDCDGTTDEAEDTSCQCTPTGNPDTNCDGVDDDCNGIADDGYVGDATTCGVGACEGNTGEFVCVNAEEVDNCDPLEGATPDTICDGIDDNCDGTADSEYVITDTDCGNGECASTGQMTCIGGAEVDSCTEGTATSDNNCNGLDDNCDGTPDSEYVIVPSTCGQGECAKTGEQTCVNGTIEDSCVPGDPLPEEYDAETCIDTFDNDCDGVADANDSDCDDVMVEPQAINFGCVDVGSNNSSTVTVTNRSVDDMTIGTLIVSGADAGDFTLPVEDGVTVTVGAAVLVEPCSDAVLSTGTSCTIHVDFDPGTEGTKSATLTDGEGTVALFGKAVEAAQDVDGDCVPASEDSNDNDASVANPESATGSGAITVDGNGLALAEVATLESGDEVLNQSGNPGYAFTDGMVQFKVEADANGNATVTLTFPTPFAPGAKYYKVDDQGFYEYEAAVFDNAANTVTLPLTDGGARNTGGDRDNAVNGTISDPGGVGAPVVGGGGGGGGGATAGGGGCFINTAASGMSFSALYLGIFTGMAAVIGMMIRRRK